jgi:hypothetical protein
MHKFWMILKRVASAFIGFFIGLVYGPWVCVIVGWNDGFAWMLEEDDDEQYYESPFE